MRKSGFTLAEVLIVLGVIGIVAVLTIPTLMKNIDENRWKTAHEVFENRMNEALSQMHARGRLTIHANTADFVAELNNYMKIMQVCAVNQLDCFTSKIDDGTETGIDTSIFKSATNFGHPWNTDVVGLKLANGSSVLVAYKPGALLDPAATGKEVALETIAMIYDTNGTSKPDVLFSGDKYRDVYYFNIVQNNGGCGDARYDAFEWPAGSGNTLCIAKQNVDYNCADAGGNCQQAAMNKCSSEYGGRLPSLNGAYYGGNSMCLCKLKMNGGAPMCGDSVEATMVANYFASTGVTSGDYWTSDTSSWICAMMLFGNDDMRIQPGMFMGGSLGSHYGARCVK